MTTPTLHEIIAEQTSRILDAERIAANLRDEIADRIRERSYANDVCECLKAENAKLREALALVVAVYDKDCVGHTVSDAFNKARAALGEAR